MNWQYLIIGILFMVALIYLWNKFIIPFSKKKDGCGNGCGCVDIEELEKKQK